MKEILGPVPAPFRTRKRSQSEGPTIDNLLPPIVWAIDAFPTDDDIHLRTAEMIAGCFAGAPVHPVYVLAEESFADRGFSNFLRPALKPMALKALGSLIRETRELRFRKPRVLMETSASRPACARKLMRYAERIGARMIALGTHERRGFSRFLAGSFSEAVISNSRCPVILSGPHMSHVAARPRLVIFPTDFSEACKRALPDVFKLARSMGAEIHFFHKELHLVDPLVQSGVNLLGGGWVSVEPYMSQPADAHTREADEWCLRAKGEGLTARYIGENFREPTSSAIVEYARTHSRFSPILALVPQTGPVASRFLGSVTRDVIRTSPCPVYLTAHEP